MRIINGPFGVKFEDGVKVYFGTALVEHRKVKKGETELEVAIQLLEHFKENGLYNRWLKVDQMTEEKPEPLYKMKNEAVYLHYLKGSWVKALKGLEEKLLDTSLTEMWNDRGV